MTIQNITDREIALSNEVEQLRVQLAGCGVAAMQNTEDSKASRVEKGTYGYSESYADVCRAVDREIQLRDERDTLQARVAELEALIEASRKQEPVAWFELNEYLDAWFLDYTPNPKAKTRPLYAAPVVAPDVLKDAERYRWLCERHDAVDSDDLWHVRNGIGVPVKANELDAEIDSAIGGAND